MFADLALGFAAPEVTLAEVVHVGWVDCLKKRKKILEGFSVVRGFFDSKSEQHEDIKRELDF